MLLSQFPRQHKKCVYTKNLGIILYSVLPLTLHSQSKAPLVPPSKYILYPITQHPAITSLVHPTASPHLDYENGS